MRFPTVDEIGVAIGLVAQASLVFVLFRKGLAKSYPIFTAYLLVNLVEDPLFWIFQAGSPSYTRFYYGVTILDYILQLLILFEVGWNVLRPSNRSLRIPLVPMTVIAVLVCTIISVSFSPHVELEGLRQVSEMFVRLTLALAVLKLLLFAVLAGFAQFLGIGWKNHVLQLASGLALYGAVSLLVQLSIRHLQVSDRAAYSAHYLQLLQLQSAAFLCTVMFWAWAFSRNEAPRKEFTPQMQQVLVTIAQSAKRTRLAVTRSTDRR